MVPVYLTQRYLRNKKIMSANYFVPSAGVRKAFRQTKKIYKAFKVENRLHLLVGKEGHRFYQDLAWPVIKKHL